MKWLRLQQIINKVFNKTKLFIEFKKLKNNHKWDFV